MRRALARLVLGLGVLMPTLAAAQISPGELSRSHAALEGSGRCLECHEPGEGPSPGKCLACHAALKERIEAKAGLHARDDHRDCKLCHVDHQGVDFDLVYWGKEGRSAFDHAATGYVLEGKHRGLGCEACHQARFNRLADRLAAGKAGARTFLGLAPACRSCHPDPHGGTRFAGQECTSCHSPLGFRPVARFDHAATGFPLTGKHGPLGCERCHRGAPPEAGAAGRRVLRAVGGRECASCHEDVHAGRLGAACANCHTTASWRGATARMAERKRFDHDRAGYPLKGRHASVACASCHAAGRPLRLKHERCTDCHGDSHRGQLAKRADQGRCESCHDLSGFAPARFSVEDHQKTGYPLLGAHLAVACNACHRSVSPSALPASGVRTASLRNAAGGGGRTAVFRFAATRCADCHKDPHQGEVDRHMRKGGCEACHRVEAWAATSFDHATTRLLLTGGHAKPACAACHRRVEKGAAKERLRLSGLPLECESCHKDPHAGQFVSSTGKAACDRCHTTTDVSASRFDHDRDSAYKLDGAHAKVACSGCHPTETRAGIRFVRYKPVGKACKDCHAAGMERGRP